jgi:hypothetical protein
VSTGGGVVTRVSSQVDSPPIVAVDGTRVYWGDEFAGMFEQPVGTNALKQLLLSDSGTSTIAVDSTSIYFTDGRSVDKMPLAGGIATPLASGAGVAPLGGGDLLGDSKNLATIAVDATGVYWANVDSAGNGSIRKVSLDGSTLTTLASGPNVTPTGGLALSGSNLYWTNGRNVVCLGATCAECPSTMCSGQCVDTSVDPGNCGGCGVACASGQVCESGACTTCPSTAPDFCNGTCTALASDPGNCGGCGNVCAAGTSCQSGTCL